MNKKTKALIYTIVTAIIGAGGIGGFKVVSPHAKSLVSKVNEVILNQEVDLYLRFPKSLIDSVKNEIETRKYLHKMGH